MTTASTTHLRKLLTRTGLFTEPQLDSLLDAATESDLSLTEVVVQQTGVLEEAYLEALSTTLRIPFIEVSARDIEPDVLEQLPTKAVFQYKVIPVAIENGALLVAANDPLDAEVVDALRLASGMRVRLAVSTAEEIAKAAKAFYGVGAETVDRMMQDNRFEVSPEEELAAASLNELDQEASVVKFVNQIIWEAVQQGATDIHLEPMEASLRIRYRIDGVLHQTPVPPSLVRFQAAIISRIKVMANLDIAEKRLPMDGRIGLRVQNQDIDIRVSTMPTTHGESISLRLLQRSGQFISLQDLGMSPRDAALIGKVVHRPNGIVLVTGPTGSGKSTSLYAYLNEINTIDQRILTAEDPIEYQMAGINQVLVRPEIGLTFARALRSFLRQDPDVIMVGEVRDLETAEIAIQAALTGHLVFSTLHTNDSAGAFTRLLDMGVEPFLVASAVEAVVAQRLVRKLCGACREPSAPTADFLNEIGFPVDEMDSGTVYTASRCSACRNTGFRGRNGIFEVLQVSEDVESMVIQRRSSSEIKQKAMQQGMSTLRQDGWMKVIDGVTTIDEVLRVTEENA